jgi:hypothetical protein
MKLIRFFLLWSLLLGVAPLAIGQQSKEKDRKERNDSKRDNRWSEDESDRTNNASDQKDKKEEEDQRGGQWKEDGDEDAEAFEMADSRERGSRAPNSRNRAKKVMAGDPVETQALAARDNLAENHGIRKPKDRDDLLSACRKYYRAKELLDAQYPNKDREDYRKKAQVLEREYSRELRQVLPVY